MFEGYGHAQQQHAFGVGRDIDGLAINFAGLLGGNIELIRAGRDRDIIRARALGSLPGWPSICGNERKVDIERLAHFRPLRNVELQFDRQLGFALAGGLDHARGLFRRGARPFLGVTGAFGLNGTWRRRRRRV